jgi:HEAT repeat protein
MTTFLGWLVAAFLVRAAWRSFGGDALEDREWAEAAARLGASMAGRSFTLQRGALQLSAAAARGGGESRVRFTVARSPPFPADLTIGPDFGARGSETYPRVVLGDPSFDKWVTVRAPEAEALALLDKPTREVFRTFVLEGGTLSWTKLELLTGRLDEAGLVRYARLVLSVAESLGAVGAPTTPERLLERVTHDPDPEVRGHCLRALHEAFPGSTETKLALEVALRDRDPGLRFDGAKLAGDDDAKWALDTLASDAALQPGERLRALGALLERFPYAEVQPLVAQAWESRDRAVRVAAIRAAGEARDQTGFARFCELAKGTHLETCAAAIAALGRLGDPRAEPLLLAVLQHDGSPLRAEAAEALGLVGSIHAVEPLLPFTHGVLPSRTREAARAAVQQIQARLGDAAAGRLSLVQVGEREGEVSLAPAGGEVSLASKPDKLPQS